MNISEEQFKAWKEDNPVTRAVLQYLQDLLSALDVSDFGPCTSLDGLVKLNADLAYNQCQKDAYTDFIEIAYDDLVNFYQERSKDDQ